MNKKYAELLKTSLDVIKKLSEETQTAVHLSSQAVVDMEGLQGQINEKREKIAAMEHDLKTRHVNYESGLEKMRNDLERKLGEVETLRKEAIADREIAKRERNLAEQLREEAEDTKKELQTVSSVAGKVKR